MKSARYFVPLVATVAALGLGACDTTSTIPSLFNDSTATLDVATSSGDAIAAAIATMQDNETTAAIPAAEIGSSALLATTVSNPTIVRTRTCYDANGAVVAGCTPVSSVRKVVSHVTIDGARSRSNSTTGGTSATWTGALHRVSNDTVVRNFSAAQPPVETSRTHTDLGVGHDTTTFTDGTVTRLMAEVTRDSVKGVTWNMPRTTNPFPISGSIVRVDSVHVSITKATQTNTKDLVRVVEVDFPADAQGNVVLKVNAKTCNLNLVTHDVSGCH